MTIDLDRARAETPGVANVLHLNNAGASLPPAPVVARMIGYLEREAAIGGYEAEAEAEPEIDAVYDSIARMIGAARDEIAVVRERDACLGHGVLQLPVRAG